MTTNNEKAGLVNAINNYRRACQEGDEKARNIAGYVIQQYSEMLYYALVDEQVALRGIERLASLNEDSHSYQVRLDNARQIVNDKVTECPAQMMTGLWPAPASGRTVAVSDGA